MLRLTVIIAATLATAPLLQAQEPIDPERLKTAIEALERLKGADLESNERLKSSVLKVLNATKGTPAFVQITRDFNIPGQGTNLLEIAQAHSSTAIGAEATRMILESPEGPLLTQALRGPQGAKAAEALGNSASRKALPFLQSALSDPAIPNATRQAATHALAKSEEGALWLLAQVKEGTLPEQFAAIARLDLSAAPWPAVKSAAAQVFARQTEETKLPPVSALVKMRGDPERGAEIFKKPEVGCANCHQVNGEGIDFGPSLSEIGTKLGKDALYQSILDPSNGIAFGYEAWALETKDGDEAFGLQVSETADSVTLKTQSGIATTYKKAELAKREKQEQSIMPAGLEQAMSVRELVDLVEYLSTLRKAP